MADFSVSPVAQNVKPPASMSLADMVNLARSGQAFQQAQQINPLEVQRSRTELSRLQQLIPEELARAQAEANRAVTEADVSEKTAGPRIDTSKSTASSAASTSEKDRLGLLELKSKKIASSQISMINNPLIIAAEKNPTAANKLALINLVKQNGMNIAKDLDIKPDEAMKLLQPYLDIAINDPGRLRGYFKERHIQGLDDASRTDVFQPKGIAVDTGTSGYVVQTNEFGPVPVGQVIAGTPYTRRLMLNESMVLDAAGNQVIVTKDSNGQITSIRSADQAGSSSFPSAEIPSPSPASSTAPPLAAPSAVPAPAKIAPRVGDGSAVAPKQNALVANLPAVAQTDANLPVFSKPILPRYPVRDRNKPVLSYQLGEKEAQEAGGTFLRNSLANRGSVNPIIGSLEKIVTTTDQLMQDTISKAGKGLAVEQYVNKMLDDSKYKELSKQLAKLQMALIGNNPQALSSDAGKQMSAAATGSEIYPPEVLQKIAVQTYGEMQARDKLGTAADNYARKFGENNMASFSQMWDNNSDSKVFELMALPKLIKDKDLRAKMANQIIGYPIGSEERTIIEQKYKNIQKLIKDGTL
jgi:hypothetical protein